MGYGHDADTLCNVSDANKAAVSLRNRISKSVQEIDAASNEAEADIILARNSV